MWRQPWVVAPGSTDRELLLAAGLRLFSEQGIDAVSIRAVNREAGLGPASVHYHFGTKEALVEAVVHAYGEEVIRTTKARAKEILEAEARPTARDLVTMLSEPYLALMQDQPEEGVSWVRVISSLLQSEPDLILDRPSARLTWNAASRVYPDADARGGAARHADGLHPAGHPAGPDRGGRGAGGWDSTSTCSSTSSARVWMPRCGFRGPVADVEPPRAGLPDRTAVAQLACLT